MYGYQLTSLLLLVISIEPNGEDGPLPFSSQLFPSASGHRELLGHNHMQKGEPQFEVVCTLASRLSSKEYLN